MNAKVLSIFAAWLQRGEEPNLIEAFIAKKQTLEQFVSIFLQSPRSKVFVYVFGQINIILESSALIAKSFAENDLLVRRFTKHLLIYDSTQAQEESEQKPHHHPKQSINAKSIYALLQLKEADLLRQPANKNQTQILKEFLWTIYHLGARDREGIRGFVERHQLLSTVRAVAKLADAQGVLVLQQATQEILGAC